ncbi:MAG: hypothetical protein EZS28_040271, partial [Streblomastix strix]
MHVPRRTVLYPQKKIEVFYYTAANEEQIAITEKTNGIDIIKINPAAARAQNMV